MEPINARIAQAQQLWLKGEKAEQSQDYQTAYELFTKAHDLVIDCPKQHAHAHVQLRRVNKALGHYGELTTDWILHALSPLGVFEAIAFFTKSSVSAMDACKR